MGTRPICNRMAMSTHVESSYGTALTAASEIDQMFELQEPALFEPELEFVDDAGFLKGHEWAEDVNKRILVAEDGSLPFSFPSSLEALGLLFSLAMGDWSVSGAPSDYTHTYLMQDACASGGDSLPSTGVITGFLGDTASYFQYDGVMVNDMNVNIDSNGWLPVTGTLYTNGDQTDASAYTFPSAFTSSDFITGAQTVFELGEYGTSYTAYTSVFRGMNFSINNNLDRADARSNIAAAGTKLSELRFGDRQITFNVTVQGHQSSTTDSFWDWFVTNQLLMAKVTVTKSATRKLIIELPKCNLAKVTQSFDGMRDVLELQFTAMYDATTTSPLKVQVLNGVALYQEAAA